MNRVKHTKPARGAAEPCKFNREAYAQVALVFRQWCDERGLSFPVEVGTYMVARMAGGEAPALSRELAGLLRDAVGGVVRRPNHPGNRAARAPLLVCDDFPGRVFTHTQAGRVCGKRGAYPVSRYVQRGAAIPGTAHVFRHAGG